MKNLLIILFVLSSLFSAAQPVVSQPMGTPKTALIQKGWLKNDSGFVFPVLDTTRTPVYIGETVLRMADTTFYVAISTSVRPYWIKLRGYYPTGTGTGSVTSVGASIGGSVLSVGGSPITGSGTLAFTWNGAATDVVLGNGAYTPYGTLITSITDPLYSPIGHSHVSSDISDFTTAVRGLLSSGSGISYNPSTGVISATLSGTGISSLNGLTDTAQTFATGTSGTDFNISSVGTAHTFNIPFVSNTTIGKLDSSYFRKFDSSYTVIKNATVFDTTKFHSYNFYNTKYQPLLTYASPGQIMAVNGTGDGYEWVNPIYVNDMLWDNTTHSITLQMAGASNITRVVPIVTPTDAGLITPSTQAFIDSIRSHNQYFDFDSTGNTIGGFLDDSTIRFKSIRLKAGTNVTLDSNITSGLIEYTINATGGGNPNANIGSGFRLAVPFTNNIKTLFAGSNKVSIDSTSNTNGITVDVNQSNLTLTESQVTNLTTDLAAKVNVSDTATMLSKYLRKVDTASLSTRINAKQNIVKWGADFSTNGDSVFLKGDFVNIKDFGAVDDNSTDNSSALANAVATGKNVYIPTGYIFKYSTGITLNAGQVIFGAGERSQLQYTGSLRAISLNDSSKVINFKLIGSGKTSGHAFETGIYCDSHINFVVQDMFIINFGGNVGQNGGGGIYMGAINGANSEGGNIINCRVLNNNAGINLEQRAEYINIVGGSISNNTVGLGLGTGNFSVVGTMIEANGTGVKIYSGTNNGHGVFSGVLVNHSTTYALDIQDVAQALGVQFSACDFYYGSLFFKNANNIRFLGCNISSIDSIHLDNSYFVSFSNTMLGKTGLGAAITINKYNGATDIEQWNAMRFDASTPTYSTKQINADTISWKGPLYHSGTTPASSSSSDSVWVKSSTGQWKLRAQSDIGGGGSSTAYGNTGNIQIDSAGYFRTPQGDSLTFSGGKFQTKGTINQGNSTNYLEVSTREFFAGGSGGTSYANTGGTGDRTASITVTNSGIVNGTDDNLVNGNTTENAQYFNPYDVSTAWIKFDFGAGASKVIDEAKWYQSTTASHGTWKFQGSNDNSSWSDVGTSFTLGSSATQTITNLSGNTTGYRYYRLTGVSGTGSSTPYVREIEFKIGDAGGGGGAVDTIYRRIQAYGTNSDIAINDSISGHVAIGTHLFDSTFKVNGSTNLTGRLRVGTIDSTSSPVNMLYQATDGTIKKAAVPASTPNLNAVTAVGNTSNQDINVFKTDGAFDVNNIADYAEAKIGLNELSGWTSRKGYLYLGDSAGHGTYLTTAANTASQFLHLPSADGDTLVAKSQIVRTLDVQYTDTSNAGSTETDLMSYTIPANTFVNNGDRIIVEANFTTASNANSKDLKYYFAGNSIDFTSSTIPLGSSLDVKFTIIKTGSNAVRIVYSYLRSGNPIVNNIDLSSITFSGTIISKFSFTGTATGDGTQKSMTTTYYPR